MAAPSDQEKDKLLNAQIHVRKKAKILNDTTLVIYLSGFLVTYRLTVYYYYYYYYLMNDIYGFWTSLLFTVYFSHKLNN